LLKAFNRRQWAIRGVKTFTLAKSHWQSTTKAKYGCALSGASDRLELANAARRCPPLGRCPRGRRTQEKVTA